MRTILSGLRAWTVQRLTAVYLLLFLLFALVGMTSHPRATFAEWHAWVTSGAERPAMMLFFAVLLLHAWVGLRDVLLDYVKPLPLRAAALGILALVLAALGSWVLQILINA